MFHLQNSRFEVALRDEEFKISDSRPERPARRLGNYERHEASTQKRMIRFTGTEHRTTSCSLDLKRKETNRNILLPHRQFEFCVSAWNLFGNHVRPGRNSSVPTRAIFIGVHASTDASLTCRRVPPVCTLPIPCCYRGNANNKCASVVLTDRMRYSEQQGRSGSAHGPNCTSGNIRAQSVVQYCSTSSSTGIVRVFITEMSHARDRPVKGLP